MIYNENNPPLPRTACRSFIPIDPATYPTTKESNTQKYSKNRNKHGNKRGKGGGGRPGSPWYYLIGRVERGYITRAKARDEINQVIRELQPPHSARQAASVAKDYPPLGGGGPLKMHMKRRKSGSI